MPLRTAGRLCPQGVFLPVDGRKYQAVEPRGHGDPAALHAAGRADLDRRGVPRRDRVAARCSATASTIAPPRSRPRSATSCGLTASVGVGPRKLVAKIASDLRKPDGLVVVPPGDEAAFLAPLPISRLWGVGEQDRRGAAATSACGRSATWPRCRRTSSCGGSASTARPSSTGRAGIDPDPVATGEPAKSVSHEHTFDVDTADREVIERTLLGMADGVAWRLRVGRPQGRDGHAQAARLARSRPSPGRPTLEIPADLTEPIYEAAVMLLRRELHGQRIRLVGVTASNFRDREQLALFGDDDPRRAPDRGGARPDPAQVRRAVDHPGEAGPIARARAVRARPDVGGRDPCRTSPARPRGRGGEPTAGGPVALAADGSEDDLEPADDRDSLGDTDVPEDAGIDA